MRFILPVVLLLISATGYGEDDFKDTFARLDAIRASKEKQLQTYLHRLEKTADAISGDAVMCRFFAAKLNYYRMFADASAPPTLKRAIEDLKRSINEHYLANYMLFYDILFVARDGEIFYTIRKEADYHKNLFKGSLSDTAVAKYLERHKQAPTKGIVNFQKYMPTGDPSAFFVRPAIIDGEDQGWFLLQCNISRINAMFVREDALGRTGEVILVNENRYMLTDSRFFGESSILERHLSPENMEAKFAEGKGHKIVTDYRGKRAITSFATQSFGHSRWLLIAKIDEDEILTEAFLGRTAKEEERILARLSARPHTPDTPPRFRESFKRVDMDEFQKMEHGRAIGTFGVSTCTAIVVSLPGRFVYLGHLSPIDRIYDEDGTDLISHIFRQMLNFDLTKSELSKLRVTLVAPHLKGLMRASEKLIEAGLLVSQIHVLHNGQADYANVYSDSKGDLCVEWVTKAPAYGVTTNSGEAAVDLGDVMKAVRRTRRAE